MLWILLTFILFPFLLKALHNRRVRLEIGLQNIIPGPISRFIYLMSHRLPVKTIGYQVKRELCVWNLQVVEFEEPVNVKVNHLTKMRNAYLAHGKLGLINYVTEFLNPEQVEEFRNSIFQLEVE